MKHDQPGCRACGSPAPHPTGESAACWSGLARMAHAKQVAGGDWFPFSEPDGDGNVRTVWRWHPTTLTDVEQEAVRRHPIPVRLTPTGYREAP